MPKDIFQHHSFQTGNSLKKKISNKDLEKFSRQILIDKIGLEGQLKIFESKVLIVGCGGLGSIAATYLSMSGVRKIGLVDNDKIELSNIPRQLLFFEKDIGKYKTDILKKKLSKQNPDSVIEIFNKKFSKGNSKEILKKYNIVLDCSDNFSTKYLLNDQCYKYKKVLVSAALFNFELQLFAFKSWVAGLPCYRCIFPKKTFQSKNCSRLGILSTVAGIGGIFQANMVLNIILEKSNKFFKMFYLYNSLTGVNKIIKINKNRNCKICNKIKF